MIIANLIGGASASSRENSVVLSGFVKHAIPGIRPVVHHSIGNACIDGTLEILSTSSSTRSLLLIGKSLGAVRTWWLAYNHWDEIKHFKKIRVILIDPHGWQRGDGRWGSYGRKMLNGKWRNLQFNDEWRRHPNFKIVNLYQRNEYPRGAMLNILAHRLQHLQRCMPNDLWRFMGVNIGLDTHANHWNCTDIKTETGKFVAGVIRDVVEGLE